MPRGGDGRGAHVVVDTGVVGGAVGPFPRPPAVAGGSAMGAPRDPRVQQRYVGDNALA